MSKLSTLKDFIDLIGSLSAAWPVIIVLLGAIAPFVVSLPPSVWVVVCIVVVLALAVAGYQLRRRFTYLPLSDASRIAYEQLDGTIWKVAAERMHDQPSPENTLNYMAQLLINDDGLSLYGVKPPSSVVRQIDSKTLKRSAVKENCTWLRSSDVRDLPWTNLAVQRSALKVRIKQLKEGNLPTAQQQPDLPHDLTRPIAKRPRKAQGAVLDPSEILRRMVDADGMLLVISSLEGTNYQVGMENLNRSFEARELAYVHEAVEALERSGLISVASQTTRDTFYRVTAAGYRQAGSGL